MVNCSVETISNVKCSKCAREVVDRFFENGGRLQVMKARR